MTTGLQSLHHECMIEILDVLGLFSITITKPFFLTDLPNVTLRFICGITGNHGNDAFGSERELQRYESTLDTCDP